MADSVRVFIEKHGENELRTIQDGLAFMDIASRIKLGDAVFIKPNLTFPNYKRGVMTRPECVERLVAALTDYTDNITIGESDGGGYNRFPMESVFEKTGLVEIAAKYNAKLVNLSTQPSRNIHFAYKGRKIFLPLPTFLLDEVQLFITVPVPKVHANTGVSMSIKNQWGCIQDPSQRLRLHPFFKKVIFEINQALNVRMTVIDGKFGLTRNGPMRGDPVKLGWILMSDDILAADRVCCRLMGIDPDRVDYLNFFRKNKLVPDIDEIRFNRDYRSFIGSRLNRPFLAFIFR